MRHLIYENYQSGHSGLSNGIMSIEIGVVLAFLTNRFLVLEGNVSPPANVVSYGGRVSNEKPSRVTDLIDLPVPWAEPEEAELGDALGPELTDRDLAECVYYAPENLDVESADAVAFARGREHWLHAGGELDDTPLLRLTEQPMVLERGRKRHNLSFYSYFFYLDDETRRSVYRMLERMRPKEPLAALASQVTEDLGPFNAVHLRRGDFKVTYGVTTLERQSWEAIEAMDHHFQRDDRLVIVTDERQDPFFDEIKAAYPDHVFIDHHILDHYGEAFDALPCHDSIALAYLSQLVAAESKDFIGTMTSTFTSIIQRYRGNRGLQEPFRFFWNELPDPEDRIARGRHPISQCVPLDRGVMVAEADGPYSWNRYSQRLAPAWMREWPESFLTERALETGALPGGGGAPMSRSWADQLGIGPSNTGPAASSAGALGLSRVHIPFEGVRVAVAPRSDRLALKLVECFAVRLEKSPSNVVEELEVVPGEPWVLKRGELVLAEAEAEADLMRALKRELVPILHPARPRYTWLAASAFGRDGKGVVIAGDLGQGEDQLPDALCSSGWDLLWDDVVALRARDWQVVPFGRSSWPKGARVRTEPKERPLAAVVLSSRLLKTRDEIVRLSPSVAVAELIGSCLEFRHSRREAVLRLCRLVESLPVYKLSFSRADRAVELLGDLEISVKDSVREEKIA